MVGKMIGCLGLVGLIGFVYLQALGFDFVRYDDPAYVTANPMVQRGLTVDGVRWAFTTGHFSNWHPLTWLSLMADVSLHGVEPRGMHATNLLLHVAGTLLLFLALVRLSRPVASTTAACFVVAALYAIHPLHVESVAAIAERKGILSTFFFMACLWLYPAWALDRKAWANMALFGCLVAGLMCKQMLVTLPALLLLLDRWPLCRRESWGTLIREKSHLFVVVAVFSVVAYWAQASGGALSDLESAPVSLRSKNAIVSAATYLWKAAWPSRLAAVYPLNSAALTPARVAIAGGFLAMVAIIAWRLRQRAPQILFGLSWYLVALAPVCGFVQIGSHARADRYSDVPLIGIWIAVVWSTRQLLERSPARSQIQLTLAASVIVAFAIVAHRQAGYWENSRTLFERTVAVTENNHIALNNLGLVYRDLGLKREAAPMFAESIRVYPANMHARANLGNLLATLGDPAAALEHLAVAAQLKPDDATVHSSLARAYFLLGKYAEAEAASRHALTLDPQLPTAHGNLGTALMELGKKDEGIAELETAVRLSPADPGFQYNLAAAYATTGKPAEAKTILNDLLANDPNNPAARRLLGMIESSSLKIRN